MLIAGDVVDVDIEHCGMFTLPSVSASSESLIDIAVVLESGMGMHASTPNLTIIFMLNIS